MKTQIKLSYTGWVLLWAWLLLPPGLSAQHFPQDKATGKIIYAEEVLVKDGAKTELYDRAKAWLRTQRRLTIQTDNFVNGTLIARFCSRPFMLKGSPQQAYVLWHTLKIELEDDRYWYHLYNLQLQKIVPAAAALKQAPPQALEALVSPQTSAHGSHARASRRKELQLQTQKSTEALIQDLKKHML